MPGLHRRPSVLAVLVALAATGVWWLTTTEPRPDADTAREVEAPKLVNEAPPQPFLVGRGSARGTRKAVKRSAPSAADTPPESVEAKAPSTAIQRPGAMLGPLFPVAPGTVNDGVAAAAREPIVLPRAYVVGRVGPYGVREDPASAWIHDWTGVAELERQPAENGDDTREPITTAVRGSVQAAGGKPIGGAEVILYSCFYLRQVYYDHRVRQIGRTITGADGTFDVRPIDLDTVHFGADGEVLVTVRHPRYPDIVAQALLGIVPGKESDVGTLVMPAQPALVYGVVKDLQGRPVEGAAVRASGVMNPVDYDKTERMVVLGACPTAMTDAEGRYELTDFAGGVHEISIHVNIDCVLHVRGNWTGKRQWSPRVLAGNGIRGRVVDPSGEPVSAAVVAGGGNWTPTNADGTFWLDNIQAGPLTLEVAHHAWRAVFVPGVEAKADAEILELELKERLPRVSLEVVDADERSVPLVAIDWVWAKGGGPVRFAPDSRNWHDPRGEFELIVPEGATGAVVSKPDGSAKALVALEDLTDRARVRVVLTPPER